MLSLSSLAGSDRIPILCSRCDRSFGENYRRIRAGFERQCPHCQRIIVFSDDIEDPSIKRAMRLARARRNMARENKETEKVLEQNRLRTSSRTPHAGRGRILSRGFQEQASD